MASISLLGFLPWDDAERGISVALNPAQLAASRCASEFATEGVDATFVPVEVSNQGIARAMQRVQSLSSTIVVALGRTPNGPRVERWGRVPSALSPARSAEETPWLLAPDADELAAHLSTFAEPEANTEAFVASDDAGAYFCDHLCVELVRDARARGSLTRFLHVSGIDGLADAVQEARIRQYVRQVRETVDWLANNVTRHKRATRS